MEAANATLTWLAQRADSHRLWRACGYVLVSGTSVLLLFEALLTPGALLRAYVRGQPEARPPVNADQPRVPSPVPGPQNHNVPAQNRPSRTPYEIFEAAERGLVELQVADVALRRRVAGIAVEADQAIKRVPQDDPVVGLWAGLRRYRGYNKELFDFYRQKLALCKEQGKQGEYDSGVSDAESWSAQENRTVRDLDRDLDRVESVVRRIRGGPGP